MTTTAAPIEAAEVVAAVRSYLNSNSGRQWSVTTGTGTTRGWVYIVAKKGERMNDQQRQTLSYLLKMEIEDIHPEGVMIPATQADRREILGRISRN